MSRTLRGPFVLFVAAAAVAGCRSPRLRAPGQPVPTVRDARERAEREEALDAAEAEYLRDPTSEDAAIWYGRRLAYLGCYEEAIAVYSDALAIHPDSARLLRHRGHRFITLRRFPEAVADLERAAARIEGTEDEIEPDGRPNPAGIPTSTLHGNVWYHLGLAYFVQADFASACRAYRECLAVARNDDMACATRHWLYQSLRRLGEDEAARQILEPIHAEMDILENNAYHELLLFYKGERSRAEILGPLQPGSTGFSTTAYGVASWHLANGETEEALELLHRIVTGDPRPAFGSIAAEADLARVSGGC